MITRQSILTIDEIVFVNLSVEGKPEPHGYTAITYERDRIPTDHLRQPRNAPRLEETCEAGIRSRSGLRSWLSNADPWKGKA